MIKIFIFCAKSFNFDQTYLNTGLKTQNVEELSLDLIFHNNFWFNVKIFSKQNCKFTLNWTEINQNFQCEMCTVVMNECIWVSVINLNTSLMLLPAGMTLFRHVLMAFKASRPPPLRKLHLFAAKSLTPVSNFVCSLHERL